MPTPTPTPLPTPEPMLVEIVGGGGGDAAPWWGVPVIAGGFLVVGAVLGFFFNRWNEDRKAKREDARRWHDEVRTLAAQIILSARAGEQAAGQMHNLYVRPKSTDPDDRKADIDAERQTMIHEISNVQKITAELRLVAPESVNKAARSVLAALIKVRFNTVASADHDASEARDNVRTRAAEFTAAVRGYLGTKDEPAEAKK